MYGELFQRREGYMEIVLNIPPAEVKGHAFANLGVLVLPPRFTLINATIIRFILSAYFKKCLPRTYKNRMISQTKWIDGFEVVAK